MCRFSSVILEIDFQYIYVVIYYVPVPYVVTSHVPYFIVDV